MALECAGRELQIRVSLGQEEEGEEEGGGGQKEGEEEQLVEEATEKEIQEETTRACRPKKVQFSPWTPIRGSL